MYAAPRRYLDLSLSCKPSSLSPFLTKILPPQWGRRLGLEFCFYFHPEKRQACYLQSDLNSSGVITNWKNKDAKILIILPAARWEQLEMAARGCLLALCRHHSLCSSQTLPFLNIWSNLSKEFASVNPDWPIKTRRFQVQ